MTFSRADFQHIKWSLLVFLLVLCMAGATIIASENLVVRAQREQQDAQRQLNAARGQLATAREDHGNMEAYTLEYGELLNRNIIGDDSRLDWIEGLEEIRKQNRVLDFNYTISPQQLYMPPVPLDGGSFELKLSGMTLRLELLHEGQLLDFFDALRSGVNGWFIPEHCALKRTATQDAEENFSGTNAQLTAECTGGWLTLNNRNGK